MQHHSQNTVGPANSPQIAKRWDERDILEYERCVDEVNRVERQRRLLNIRNVKFKVGNLLCVAIG